MQGQGDLQRGGDHQQERIITVLITQIQSVEMVDRLCSASRERHVQGRQTLNRVRSPDPAPKPADQARCIEGRQGSRQPDPLRWFRLVDQVVLQGFQCRPPQASGTRLVTATGGDIPGQALSQALEADGLHQRSRFDSRRLSLTTDRQRPSAMKLTTMAKRP